MYHGEKVKAALRRLPSAHERLLVVKATCEFQLGKLARAAAVIGDSGGVVGGEGRDGHGHHEGDIEWLQHAHRNVGLLLASLNATAADGGPVMSSRGKPASSSAAALLRAAGFDSGGKDVVKAAWISSPLKKGVAGWSMGREEHQQAI